MPHIPKISTILYATDLGDHTRPVFRQAIAQARAHNASIIMLHIVEPLTETARAVIAAYMPNMDIDSHQKEGEKDIIAKMQERINKFKDEEFEGQDEDNIPVKEMKVIAGRPSEEILTLAETLKVDMIIMGQSAKSILGSKVMGSTTRRVARMAKVPVLIIPNM
jgi:nucleotide-binding universal stress UspA family protein